MVRPPCEGKLTLFEPYRLEGETDGQRSERLTLAISVCGRCPLKMKQECLERGKDQDLARGVWGGTIITSLDDGKDKK